MIWISGPLALLIEAIGKCFFFSNKVPLNVVCDSFRFRYKIMLVHKFMALLLRHNILYFSHETVINTFFFYFDFAIIFVPFSYLVWFQSTEPPWNLIFQCVLTQKVLYHLSIKQSKIQTLVQHKIYQSRGENELIFRRRLSRKLFVPLRRSRALALSIKIIISINKRACFDIVEKSSRGTICFWETETGSRSLLHLL